MGITDSLFYIPYSNITCQINYTPKKVFKITVMIMVKYCRKLLENSKKYIMKHSLSSISVKISMEDNKHSIIPSVVSTL